MLLSAITHLCPKFWGGVAKMISSFEISTWINDYIPMKIVSSLIHVLIQYGLVNTKVYHGNLITTKEFPFSNWHDLVSGACSEIKWDSQRRSVAFQFRIFLSREAEMNHDDVIKWKHFPRYWPFVRRIRRSSVNPPPLKVQWRGTLTLIFDLRLNKRLSKQSRRRWWFETPSRSLWCHCNDAI